MRRRVRGHFASRPVGRRGAYLALPRGTTSGNDRLGTRAQGLYSRAERRSARGRRRWPLPATWHGHFGRISCMARMPMPRLGLRLWSAVAVATAFLLLALAQFGNQPKVGSDSAFLPLAQFGNQPKTERGSSRDRTPKAGCARREGGLLPDWTRPDLVGWGPALPADELDARGPQAYGYAQRKGCNRKFR